MLESNRLEKLWIAAGDKVEEREYWLDRLSGELVKSGFPYDYKETVSPTEPYTIENFSFADDVSAKLLSLSTGSDIRLCITLLTGLIILIYKYSGYRDKDIIVGSPVVRDDVGIEFINTILALRNPLDENMTFKETLLQVRQGFIEDHEHHNYPIEVLIKQLDITFTGDGFPLFDAVLLLENIHKREDLDHVRPNIIFSFLRTDGRVAGHVEYNSLLYERSTIKRLTGHLESLLQSSLADVQIKITDIDILSPEEKKQLLFEFNDSEVDYPRDRTLPQLFQEQVERTPDNIALVGAAPGRGFANEVSLSYKQLNRSAGLLAASLMDSGVKPGSLVGIMAARTVEMIVGILGILKTGSGYVPLNPKAPAARNKYVLEECRTDLLLTTGGISSKSKKGALAGWPGKILCLDELASGGQGAPFEKTAPWTPAKTFVEKKEADAGSSYMSYKSNKSYSTHLSYPAYVIFTSGSTGKPKGVPITHANLSPLLHWGYKHMKITPRERTLQNLSYYFDWSAWEIFIALTMGSALHMIPEEVLLDPPGQLRFIETKGITVLHITPTHFQALLNLCRARGRNSLAGLRCLAIGAEKLTYDLVKRTFESAAQECQVFNMYGPTEATIMAAVLEIDGSDIEKYKHLSSVPIGGTIANAGLLVLDKHMQLCPIGVEGELYIAGDGLSRGYLNNPELTAEKFVNSSYKSYRPNNTKLYKTGDRCRWLEDGTVEFLGRADYQVKIRGFRIELGEIENRLLEHEEIEETAVIDRERENGEKYLCAYIVERRTDDRAEGRAFGTGYPGASSRTAELREFLSASLPDYMIPAVFVTLKRMPLNPNKKIDRKALPEPGIEAQAGAYAAPRGEVEKRLAGLWASSLDIAVDQIGTNTNFFEIGGHSLRAAQLVSNIHKEFEVNIPLSEVFSNPTISELGSYIKEAAEDKYFSIEPVERKEYYVLSSAQKRLFVLQQLDTQGTGYNLPSLISVEGELDREKIAGVFMGLIRRHESFRTSFIMLHGEPVQRVHSPEEIEFALEYFDLTTEAGTGPQPMNEGEAQVLTDPSSLAIHNLVRRFIRPFDFTRAPLLRGGLIELEETRHILMLDMPHIVSDGTSMGTLLRDFMDIYAGEELPQSRIQYKDFSNRQNSRGIKESLQNQEAYWLKRFSGEAPVLDLPTDFPRPVQQSFAGDTLRFELGTAQTSALNALAAAQEATLFMVLLALFNVLLAKLSGQEDIVVGSPVAGRRHAGLEEIIGMFVNTLALRSYPEGGKTFKEFLSEVREDSLAALENQEFPYEELVEKVKVARDTGRNPLFDVMFALQNIDISGLEEDTPGAAGNLSLKPFTYDFGTTKFDLIFACEESGEKKGDNRKLNFAVEYCTRLFKEETIRRFIAYFKRLVDVVSRTPGIKLAEIDVLSPGEKQQLLLEFNRLAPDFPIDRTLPQLFQEQVERTPDNIALVGAEPGRGFANEVSLSYKQLNHSAGLLAASLMDRGVKPGSLVGIMAVRTVEMIVGILGILKTGSGYVPLNPKAPAARNKYVLEECACGMLLTTGSVFSSSDQLAEWPGETILLEQLDELRSEVTGVDSSYMSYKSNKSYSTHLSYPAYVIFTSGSTGKPKGVPITHANLSPLLHWGYKHMKITPRERTLQNLSYYFDWSVWEIFIALTMGSALHMIPEEVVLDPSAQLGLIETKGITVLHITPTHFQSLLNLCRTGGQNSLSGLKCLAIGAEKLTYDLVKRTFELAAQDCRVFNMYGPTETTIMSSMLEIDENDVEKYKRLSSVPIGAAVANADLLVLDRYLALCPVNVAGELYIAGEGLSKGYLNDMEKTSAAFIKNVYQEEGIRGECLYKTGDRVRWLEDGTVEFLGRTDQQVKIRGFRIELGEIENRLLEHEEIEEAAVIDRARENGEKYLCAYIVERRADAHPEGYAPAPVSPGPSSRTAELREFLSNSLPDYMIPAVFITLERMPLNPNKKIDRKALPEPGIEAQADTYTAPRNKIEEKLVEIWAEDLGIEKDKIGINANFFELGGHSLKAAVIVSRINKELNTTLTLKDFFSAQTIAGLAEHIETAAYSEYEAIQAVEKKTHYDLSSAQNRLYILQQIDLNDISYNMPAVFLIHGKLDRDKFEKAIQGLIYRHETLRTSFCEIHDKTVQRIEEHVDFRAAYEKIKNEEDVKYRLKDFVKPFDLSRPPLLRSALLQLSEEKHFVLFDMHHIISDGSSMEVLIAEFARLYEGKDLMPLRVQYKDYAARQNRYLNGEKFKEQEKYWLKKLDGFEFTQLPVNNVQSYKRVEGKQAALTFDSPAAGKIERFCSKYNITKFVFFITAFQVVLSRELDRADITIGIPVSIRNHFDLENLIGIFLNVVLVRAIIDEDGTLLNQLLKSKENIIDALENQDYPYELLSLKMREQGHVNKKELFSILFNYIPRDGGGSVSTGDFEVHAYETGEVSPKYDMTLYVYDEPGSTRMNLVYKANLYDEHTIAALLDDLLHIIRAVLENEKIELTGLASPVDEDTDDFDEEFEKYY